MNIPFGIKKYIYQLQAAMPNYDTACEFFDDEPIVFENSEDVRLSFAAIADTHIVNNEAAFSNLSHVFKDAENSKEKFDALLMAGDISEFGLKKEYAGFFKEYDKQTAFSYIFLTMGNHDVRFLYRRNQKIIMKKACEYLKIDNGGKSYYSYDIKGYTFIVIGTEKRVLEKAHITKQQIDFLDKELKRATANGKPAFVMCHQAFAETHGLPEVWKTGDMGEQSDEVRAVMTKYKNIFFINGHLHGGVFEKTAHVLDKENNCHSISIPSYRKPNNFGHRDCGVGYYCCVYDDKVVFTARNFLKGKAVNDEYAQFSFELI